jgi:gamma-glutamyltranspeptidase/glutathione hydrolase
VRQRGFTLQVNELNEKGGDKMPAHYLSKAERHQQWDTVGKSAISSAGGVVAAASAPAAQTGARILAAGGNAVDAAIGIAASLHVTEPWSSGLGGGGFMIVHVADSGTTHSVNFSMKSAADVDPDQYPLAGVPGKHGPFQWAKVKDDLHSVGPMSVMIPGAVAGFGRALEEFGTMSFADVLDPVIKLAEDGLKVGWYHTLSIACEAGILAQYPHSRDVFLRKGHYAPVSEGDDSAQYIRDPKMPGFLRTLQKNGWRDFYEGELAAQIAADMNTFGRSWSVEDLSRYEANVGGVDTIDYRGATIVGAPGLNGGPTALRFFSGFEKRFEATGAAPDGPAYVKYAEMFREIWMERYQSLGDDNTHDKCTTHISVVDRHGNMVTLTNTMGARFGSKVSLPTSGMLMNNGMFWFDPEPGKPNSIGPGKWPLTNACPMMVLKDGKGWLALGASGGRRVPPTVIQLISFMVDYDMTLQQAFNVPRIDPVRLEMLSCDHRMPAEHVETLDDALDVPVVATENAAYPMIFAVPAAVVRELDGTNTAMVSIDVPFSTVMSEEVDGKQ